MQSGHSLQVKAAATPVDLKNPFRTATVHHRGIMTIMKIHHTCPHRDPSEMCDKYIQWMKVQGYPDIEVCL